MATTTVDHSHTSDRPLQLDSIPTVDLRLLSQSELYSLSLCSDSAFDLRRCDDVVIPKIDRSVFNESAGSRKQTYSRLRLAPASSSSPSSIHRRTPHLRSHLPPSTSKNDPEQPENSLIINLLKELFKSDPNCIDMIPIEVEDTKPKPYLYPNSNPVTVFANHVVENAIVGKRKRGRPRKGEKVIKPAKVKPSNHNVVKQIAVLENFEDRNRDREIINSKGVVLDMVVLATLEDPYGPEIRRRTVGMSTEDQLLGFLKGLNGQWGSRRKKKRVVDASDFGDALPKGWRLSLSIKKKAGRVWLFCHRYISPSGRQFASCGEVSSYLLSIREPQNFNNSKKNNDNQHSLIVASGKELQVSGNENILAEESIDSPVRNFTTSNDKVCGMDEVPDVVAAKSDVGMVCAASLSDNENNRNCEPFGETRAIHSVDSATNKCSPEEETSGSCRLSPFPNEPVSDAAVRNVVEVSADTEMENREAVSETGFLPSSTSGKIDGTESLSGMQFTSTADEFTVDTDKVANGESLSSTPSGLDKDDVAEVKQLSSFEGSEESAEKANVLIPSLKTESEMKSSVISSIHIPSGDEETRGVDSNLNRVFSSSLSPKLDENSNLNRVSSSSLSPKLDENDKICRNEFLSYAGSGAEVLTSLEKENNFESYSAVSSWREQVCASENSGNVVSTCMVEEPRKQVSCESSLLQPDCNQACRIENHVDKVYTIELEEAKLKEFQTLRNSEPSVSAKSSQSELNPSAMTITKERNLEFCSLVSSGNEQTFDLQDDVTGIYDSTMEDCGQGNSERGLLNQFCITESSDDVYVNKLFTSPLDELKFDEDRDIANHELSLAFGNPHAGQYADPSSVEQKRDLVNHSFTPKIEQSFGVQTNLSMVNSSLVHDLKEGRGSMSDLFSLSCNSGISDFGNNVNTVYAGREWEERKSDDVGNSVNKKYMLGFGSSPYQPGEDVVPSVLWKTAEGHALQNGLADPSPPLVQSPNCFRSFDILSDKAEDELFSLREKYNNGPGVSEFRAVRSEPIEFSFLTTHNSNSFQGNPKVFSYGLEMGQEFNPSFWLGKDASMPNIAVNQVTDACVWCRNEFHHEPGHSGIQSGYGSMCPTCSARISHQVDML